jgi:RNA polymerase sigma-70 factor (ECF subfamily)
MVNNNTVAEDILQDVFVRIWRNIDQYDAGKGTLFTWMINISRHVCIDYLRSKYNPRVTKVIENPYGRSTLSTSAFHPNYNIPAADLYRVTQKLGLKNRQVVEMVFFRGHTHEEAALILNIPLGTAKSRSRAALKKLRSLYGN